MCLRTPTRATSLEASDRNETSIDSMGMHTYIPYLYMWAYRQAYTLARYMQFACQDTSTCPSTFLRQVRCPLQHREREETRPIRSLRRASSRKHKVTRLTRLCCYEQQQEAKKMKLLFCNYLRQYHLARHSSNVPVTQAGCMYARPQSLCLHAYWKICFPVHLLGCVWA